ncbi:MAG: hypothetical protein CR986_05500 [Ignavibacteriae bacterium]|nr:MAG: hypothetical protein CR986_05500 [Ignavibacteriota bacterium]
MKKFLLIFGTIILNLALAQPTEAQFWKKLKEHAKKKIEKEAEERTQKRVDKGIDKVFDETEDAIDGKGEKDPQQNSNDKEQQDGNAPGQEENTNNQQAQHKKHTPKVVWSKFDFVPGDEIIFEDGPSPMEENGELYERALRHYYSLS